MELANWLRANLWTARDWLGTLATLCDEAAGNESLRAASALDLANACELIDPDRRRAIAMYRLASRRGASDAHVRARALALEVGDHTTRAELALASFDATHDVSWLAAAGFAFLDAGTPQLAIEPLSRVVEARPRDEEARSALAAVRRQVRDPQTEVATWIARAAKASRPDSAGMYLHAARLARLAGLEAIHAKHLEAAVLRGSPEASALVEGRLLQARSADALLTFYRERLERAHNDHDWTDTMRAAGCKLFVHGVQRGLAVRLVRSCLEHAYRSRLVDIPGHLASWDVLARHARDSRSTHELMPLLVEAMTLALPDDDRLYLARLGFEITLRDAGDREAARPYAALIADLVPDDPDVSAFVGPPVRDEPVVTFVRTPALDAPKVQVAAPPPPPAAVAVVVAVEPAPPAAVPPKPAGPRAIVPSPRSPSPVTSEPVANAPRPAPGADARTLIPSAAINALRSGIRAVGLPAPPRMPDHPQRQAERIVVPIDVEVELPGGERYAAVVRDVSTLGLFVVTDRAIEIGTEVALELQLPCANALSQVAHRVSAKVVRRAPEGYGMLLVSPSRALVDGIAALSRANR